MRRVFTLLAAGSAVTFMAACGASSGDTSNQKPAKVAVQVSTTPLGKVLTDPQGRTLYMFDPDKQAASTCYDQCEQAWPALEVSGKPGGGSGVDASLLGTTTRKDGSKQVTYGKWPLYYFAADKNPGEVRGQGVGGVWWVVASDGSVIRDVPPGMVAATKSQKFGEILADGKGRTLYLFDPDKQGASVCYDKCAKSWPPLTTKDQPIAGVGVDSSLFGTITRKDGSTQVTYDKWPLYYFEGDQQTGDTNGQAIKNVWWVLDPSGKPIRH